MISDRLRDTSIGNADRTELRAGGESVPPAPSHTTIVRSDREPAEVVVRFEPSSTRWHNVLNALWDDGVIARLPDSAYRVLGALLRIRESRDGLVNAPVKALCLLTGRKVSTVYEGRAALLSHPAGLLAMPGRDMYHVLPSWGWAGRSGPDRSDGVPAGRKVFRHGGMPEPPPLRLGGKVSATAENGAVAPREARARVSNQNSEFDVDEFSTDERVEMLLRAGPRKKDKPFDRADAAQLIARLNPSVDEVRTAMRNAWWYASQNKVKYWRGFVRTLLCNRCTLFDEIANLDDEVQRVAQLVQGMIAEGSLDDEAARVLNAWWARAGDAQRAALIPRDVRDQRYGGVGGMGEDRWLLAVNRILKNHAEE